jgi:hypothetical protein
MHTRIYTMHKKRLRWNYHVSPPQTWARKNVAWSEYKSRCYKRTWWIVPNASGNLSELRLEAKEMVSTIIVIAKQHLISVVYPLTYLTWIVKWRNPSQRDDGRIQVRQVAARIVFGVISNCVSVSFLQLQHTWRPDCLNPHDSAIERNVQNIIRLLLKIHKVTNVKLFHFRFVTAISCMCVATLSLGLQGRGPRGGCESVRMKTHTPKWTPILGVGVLVDSQTFRKLL